MSEAHPIDVHVGEKVRARRKQLGVSQEALGEAIGLTFQQVQKYERGTNRISASKLFEIARALNTPVTYFYDGQPENEFQEQGDSEAAVLAFMSTAEGIAAPLAPVPKPLLSPALKSACEAICGTVLSSARQ